MQIKKVLKTVTSYTDGWTTYKLYEGTDGLLHCSCPSSIYQNRECKHLTDFYYTQEYTNWFSDLTKGTRDETGSPLDFEFSSDGTLTINHEDNRMGSIILEDMTREECKALVEEMIGVLKFMDVYVQGE